MAEKTKLWWQSKAMVGALVVAVGKLSVSIGMFLQGEMDPVSLFQDVMMYGGAALAVVGLRTAMTKIK